MQLARKGPKEHEGRVFRSQSTMEMETACLCHTHMLGGEQFCMVYDTVPKLLLGVVSQTVICRNNTVKSNQRDTSIVVSGCRCLASAVPLP
jgi:hypothetical protein